MKALPQPSSPHLKEKDLKFQLLFNVGYYISLELMAIDKGLTPKKMGGRYKKGPKEVTWGAIVV